MEAVKQRYPQLIVWIKVPGDLRAPDRVAALAAAGAGVIRLVATEQARGLGDAGEVHLKDLIRRTHLKLVEHQMRDAVTLLASGGIALAEHVAKAIICGVDGIIVDIPLLLALECRLCRNCQNGKGNPCPIETGQPHRQAGGPAHGEPGGRLEQPAPGNPGGHGHAGGAAPAGRSRPGHVQGRPG